MSRAGPPIVVCENSDSAPVALTLAERDALTCLAGEISVKPVSGSQDHYTVNPGNLVGAIQLNDLRFELKPKLEVRRLLFMLGYSMNSPDWRSQGFDFDERGDLFEAVVPGFVFQVEEALRGGPLQGYRVEEDALHTVRGRIRFNDHIRSRFGLLPPIECTFDEFTEDIEINRLLKAAIARLGSIRLRSQSSRSRLRSLSSHFANVGHVSYDPRNVPEIGYDRRTERYRGPVELARLILGTRSMDSRSGEVAGAAFLLNLATVFEDFVVAALRDSLKVSKRDFPQHAAGRSLCLDVDRRVKLEPDLSWWVNGECRFVGDVKYKRTKPAGGMHHPDLYQMLAYMTATSRSRGLLIYAAGEEVETTRRIVDADMEIVIRALDLDAEPTAVLQQIDELAELIESQAAGRNEAALELSGPR